MVLLRVSHEISPEAGVPRRPGLRDRDRGRGVPSAGRKLGRRATPQGGPHPGDDDPLGRVSDGPVARAPDRPPRAPRSVAGRPEGRDLSVGGKTFGQGTKRRPPRVLSRHSPPARQSGFGRIFLVNIRRYATASPTL